MPSGREHVCITEASAGPRSRLAASLAVLLIAAACGSSDDGDTSPANSVPPAAASDAPAETDEGSAGDPESADTATATSTTLADSTAPPTTEPAAIADAAPIEDDVDVRFVNAAGFELITQPQPVSAGDVVRTNESGYAEVVYPDGSVTRLDIDTDFEVLELTDDQGTSTTRTRMGVGRTWHRVETLADGSSYVVETSVAVATVQGTAFAVACPSDTECSFHLVEGELALTLADGSIIQLVAPQGVDINTSAPGDSEPYPLSWDVAFDDWTNDNADRDADSGAAPVAEAFSAVGPSAASINGAYLSEWTITSCAISPGSCVGPIAPGTTNEAPFIIGVDCTSGLPCPGEPELGPNDGADTFDGTTVTREINIQHLGGECPEDILIVLEPTAAAVDDGGRYVVTELLGVGTSQYRCASGVSRDLTYDIVLQRS